MKKILLNISERFWLTIILIGAFVCSLLSPIALLFAGFKMMLGMTYWETTSFRLIPTIEDGDVCFFHFRVPIKNKK